MKNILSLLPVILLLLARLAEAAAQPVALQSHAEILATITTFVQAQTLKLPGRVAIKVDEIDRRIVRPSCPALEAYLPPGSQLLGNSMVGVRCPGKKGWSLFVPVHVKVSVDMLITNKPLAQGHVLLADDISTQNGELSQTGILLDPAQAIGKVLKSGVGAGQLLKLDMLRPPFTVTQGQTVQLQVEGSGFNILSEGQALNNAGEGQPVKVKTATGRVLNGTARAAGIVEIRP
jgi:flagella basal body P-ring formation protein FlgA